jgi:hypothetical protein
MPDPRCRDYRNKSWIKRLGEAVSQLGNVLFLNGNPGLTISCQIGRWQVNGRRKGILLARIVDSVFGAGHCLRAYRNRI